MTDNFLFDLSMRVINEILMLAVVSSGRVRFGRPSPLRDSTLPTQRVSPLYYFNISIFGRLTLKIFQRRERAPKKKTRFFGRNFSKSAFLGTFWKISTKKSRFLARAPPSKLVQIDAEGAFRKVLRSVGQNGYLKIVQRGDPLDLEGAESLRGGGGVW